MCLLNACKPNRSLTSKPVVCCRRVVALRFCHLFMCRTASSWHLTAALIQNVWHVFAVADFTTDILCFHPSKFCGLADASFCSHTLVGEKKRTNHMDTVFLNLWNLFQCQHLVCSRLRWRLCCLWHRTIQKQYHAIELCSVGQEDWEQKMECVSVVASCWWGAPQGSSFLCIPPHEERHLFFT